MCDYSLHHVKTRPAKVGDKLTARDFGLGTRRVRSIGRCKRSSLRTSGDRTFLCGGGYVRLLA